MSDGDGANREFEHLRRESSNPPVAGSSGQTVAGGHVGQPAEGSSQTLSLPGQFEGSSNIRPYVFEINQLIRLYRSGERSKLELTSAITNFLNEDRDLSPKERNESFELYLAEVDSLTSPGPPGHAGKGKARGRSGPTPIGERLSAAVTTDRPLGLGGRGGERESSCGVSSSSSESDGEGPRKRRKLHPSDVPWSKRGGQHISQNPSCAKSAVIIRKLSRNLKFTKLYVKLAPGAPRGIPMSEWEHIFKGEAIDLDKVLSSLHRVTIDPERKARVGDTEISISEVETKRKVETSSEWSTAWRSASRAVAFVFEH